MQLKIDPRNYEIFIRTKNEFFLFRLNRLYSRTGAINLIQLTQSGTSATDFERNVKKIFEVSSAND